MKKVAYIMIVVDLVSYCSVYHKFISLNDDRFFDKCRLILIGFQVGIL